MGLVELYDVKPIAEFTEEDWDKTRIAKDIRQTIKGLNKGFGWLMRNPRRVIEYPVKGQLGIYNLTYTKGVIMEYPQVVMLDKKAWELLNKNTQDILKSEE